MHDAHIFVNEEQISIEVSNILDMIVKFYESFGFQYEFRFATRPDQRAGTDQMWDKAEKALEDVSAESASYLQIVRRNTGIIKHKGFLKRYSTEF